MGIELFVSLLSGHSVHGEPISNEAKRTNAIPMHALNPLYFLKTSLQGGRKVNRQIYNINTVTFV